MTLKGRVQPDHIPVNKYNLTMVGLPPVTFTSVSGTETEVAAIDLPDRTKASGGQVSSGEFTVRVPMHHQIEIGAMDTWFAEGQDPITATYKKAGVLEHTSGTGRIRGNYALTGAWVSKRKLPDLAFDDDGAMAEVEYTICYDSITSLPI